MLDFTGKLVFVAGAGSVGPGWGNGKATAVLFARQGATVFGVDIEREAIAETNKLIEAEGGRCLAHQCDMRVSAQVQAAVEACMQAFGRIDVLVNNVGGSAPGDPVTMSEEVWDAQIEHNLKTAFLGCKHVLPIMEKQGSGAIVNISSVDGLSAKNGVMAYASTKWAVRGMTRVAAVATWTATGCSGVASRVAGGSPAQASASVSRIVAGSRNRFIAVLKDCRWRDRETLAPGARRGGR